MPGNLAHWATWPPTVLLLKGLIPSILKLHLPLEVLVIHYTHLVCFCGLWTGQTYTGWTWITRPYTDGWRNTHPLTNSQQTKCIPHIVLYSSRNSKSQHRAQKRGSKINKKHTWVFFGATKCFETALLGRYLWELAACFFFFFSITCRVYLHF